MKRLMFGMKRLKFKIGGGTVRRMAEVAVDVCFYASLALLGYIFLAVFVCSSFKIPSDSMMPALLPGDFVLVDKCSAGARLFDLRTACGHQEPHIRRMPGWRDFRRNDVLVFNFPYPQRWDSIGFDILKYYVKRCIALPGDTVEIRRSRYRVRGCRQTPGWLQGQEELAALARMEERGCAPGGLSRRAYPLDDRLPWTIHEFGPLYVPARGDSLRMDRQNALLYRNLIEWEQKRKLALRGDSVMMGDSLLRGYRFRQDYYFVGGDRAVNSQDSRYWGLLPEPYIVGRVVRIWKSERPGDGRIRWDRVMKRVR